MASEVPLNDIINNRDATGRIAKWAVGFRVPADPLDSNIGVRAEISPTTYLHLTASL